MSESPLEQTEKVLSKASKKAKRMIILKRIGITISAPVWISLIIVALILWGFISLCFVLPAITGIPYICTGRFNGWHHWLLHKVGECTPTGLPFDTKPCPYGD